MLKNIIRIDDLISFIFFDIINIVINMKKMMCIPVIIIVILLCFIVHLGAKKYVLNMINKETESVLVYNNYSDISFVPSMISTTSTTTTTTEVTTTKLITKTTKPLETFKEEVDKNSHIKDNGEVVLDGMTLTELTNKLNKSLTSTLTNTGHYFANYYVKTGLDPYLAVAIVLHETGCKWTCSKLVRECNNIGGMKGSPKCDGGSYMKYDSLEEGINGYLDMLYNNYYKKGLTTPELINPKYAESTTWSEKINNYINEIKK